MKLHQLWDQSHQVFASFMNPVDEIQFLPSMEKEKSAWQTWNVFDKVSPVFTKLGSTLAAVIGRDMQVVEEFVVLLHDGSSSYKEVNEARLEWFARKQRSYVCIPLTSGALREH
ncbi:hypothetical protein Pcinc_019401 [Petrolisthes cinctipes]|uniref:Uncharacterized protein n=1 Tax=Petrolisthes cinctipes TaxID=88211 RepID=A0AAE1FM90_PETCI|nr:hypothetical protein Pcinc_019401 [Petrolisthes cinctipes]